MLQEIRTWLISQKGNWTEVVKKADVTQRTISKIVNDPEHCPTPKTLRKINRARKALS